MSVPLVRTAHGADAAAIATIYNESIAARDSTMDTEPVSPGDVEGWLARLTPRETMMVATLGDTTVGWGIVRRYSERPGYSVACETSVYLDRSRTGLGYGSAIQSRLMDFCRLSGYHHVVAKIWADNQTSIAMHRRFGFTLVGIQREIGRVDDRWRDVAILQCLLDTPGMPPR